VARVFLSYRREDAGGYAIGIQDRLRRALGVEILFMDVDSIPLGQNFVKILNDEVAKCEVLLAVIGQNWLDVRDENGNRRLDNPNDFVRIEIAAALGRDIPVIPILLNGVKIPSVDKLPKELGGLSVRNTIDVRHSSFPSDIDRLILGVQALLNIPQLSKQLKKQKKRTKSTESGITSSTQPEFDAIGVDMPIAEANRASRLWDREGLDHRRSPKRTEQLGTQPQPMRDVIVVVPGILGSVLVKDGREVWGASADSAVGNLVTFGRALKELKLAPGTEHGDPKDGVSSPRLMPRLGIIPTFWKVDGYGRFTEWLSQRFTLTSVAGDQPGNFIEFPYDWRLSNQLNAQRLADAVVPHLERWRHQTQNKDAKLIFLCHSTGGLIARWFLENLGGRDVTRKLVTIGTPYQGSVNALGALVNGTSLGLGQLGIAIDELVRSFPSAYQLLPTYSCLDVGDGQLRELAGIDLPNVEALNINEGLAFHKRVASAIETNPRYQTFAIKGVDQPTAQSAVLRGGKVEPRCSHKGTDYAGDGTVPRPSSHPPEWPNDLGSIFLSQMHPMLQSTDSVLTQLFGVLTDQLGKFMGGARIGVTIPDVVQVGAHISIEAISKDGDPSLPLHVVCDGEDGKTSATPRLMRPTGDGRYHATIGGLPEGAWRITVQSATLARRVEPVSDWTLVWKDVAQ
jgi:hypothetical protein